jgi:Xaa-Pro dipeptidase
MNIPEKAEVKEKERRVRKYLQENNYDAMIIGRQDNFYWYTCGGNNRVVITSETGFSVLVITRDQTYVIAQVMDAQRVMDEELQGLDMELVRLKWYEESREQKAAQITKGMRVLSDIPVEGAQCQPGEIYKLHYPLTSNEIEKCRWIGNKTEEILRKVADEIKPGMTEHEVEAMFLYEYGRENMNCEVVLVGSDERIAKYRHPNPSDKKIGKLALIHPGVRKWGLHANVTRMLYFGDKLPEDVRHKYEQAGMLEAATISMCIPGEKFSEILNARKQLLKEYGLADEWEYHYPGGITGYLLCDASVCGSPDSRAVINQTYDWFVTITGVKVEELSVNTEKGREVLSVTGKWPVRVYEYNGQKFALPTILMK